jgi:hypothetical protein
MLSILVLSSLFLNPIKRMSFAGEIRLFNRTIYLDRSDTPFLTVWIDRKENGTGFFTENDCKNSLLHLISRISPC